MDAFCANMIYDDLFEEARKLIASGTSADVFVKIISESDAAVLNMIISRHEGEEKNVVKKYTKRRETE